MTNIMAYVKQDKAQPSPQLPLPFDLPVPSFARSIGLVMADGLASDGREVFPGYQKVFAIGDCYLLGTGAGQLIRYVADKVADVEGSAKQLGERVVDLCRDKIIFSESPHGAEQLNFIIAGPERGALQVYHVAANRILEPLLQPSGFAVDGSGAEFVQKALDHDYARGLAGARRQETIGEIASLFFSLGRAAMKSAGVNHQLQYGFMTPEGNATLVHPEIRISHPLKEYSDTQGNGQRDKGERNARFYDAFQQRLQQAEYIQRKFNHYATLLAQDRLSEADRREGHERLDEGAELLQGVQRQLNAMIMQYVGEHNQGAKSV